MKYDYIYYRRLVDGYVQRVLPLLHVIELERLKTGATKTFFQSLKGDKEIEECILKRNCFLIGTIYKNQNFTFEKAIQQNAEARISGS